jgi:hypothetical protein
MLVIPAKAGIQTSSLRKQGSNIRHTGFRVKPGMTIKGLIVGQATLPAELVGGVADPTKDIAPKGPPLSDRRPGRA